MKDKKEKGQMNDPKNLPPEEDKSSIVWHEGCYDAACCHQQGEESN